ncbi:hypothetical protein A2704_03390 [Candidatus Kaiserbacteria bacterium RIFCSPHIGHO2_01_FULL_54_36b]|uniref:HTH arsR-type domain-containing protein n=1 Tax=Candidatus Kaiserbacteria bacterium RIFCSPHIGHO2_01_FULL_54_36b TaxID=1798483 RepID=A0A1F6CQD4_9BACT|nr:MAG: hypothetical protein A2704_03390 [Candidatus Kaiserbacteria bacterium RIFCSPHIGHO2_01_FULL_54_36b]
MGESDKELERILKALANSRRLSILRFLKKRKEASVGTIAEKIKLSFKATSRHLARLSAIDVVDKEQRSLQMFYRIADTPPEAARRIISLL